MPVMDKDPVVRLERHGDIAVIRIDNPPINAGTTAVRKGLLAAVEEFAADASLSGGVLIGAGRWFMAGSDMREINSAVLDPPLPTVIDAIEQCAKPVVAAIAGAALGGGYELALGCDARVASPEAVVGLPECMLGMMPGAGGTQRLPRLAGLPVSMGLICTGARVPAADAVRIGMIDRLVEGDLLEAAVNHVRGLGGRKRRAMELPVPAFAPADLAKAKADALAAAGDRPHIRHAIEAIETCLTLPGDEALRLEREVFNRLRTSREAAALLHLFFARRSAAKVPALKGVEARPVTSAIIVGAGPVGGQLADALREAGFPVAHVGGAGPAAKAGMAQADIVFVAPSADDPGPRDLLAALVAYAKPDAVVAVCNWQSAIAADGVARLHLTAAGEKLAIAEMTISPEGDAVAEATILALLKTLDIVTVAVGATEIPVGTRLMDASRLACMRLEESGLAAEEALVSFGLPLCPLSGPEAQRGEVSREVGCLTRDELIAFCLSAMANEAASLLADGVVSDPAHLDLLLVEGYSFPRHEGGIIFWARQQPRSAFDAAMGRLREWRGNDFRAAPYALLLEPGAGMQA